MQRPSDRPVPAEPIDLAPVALRESARRVNHVASALYTALILVVLFGLLYTGDAVIAWWDGVK